MFEKSKKITFAETTVTIKSALNADSEAALEKLAEELPLHKAGLPVIYTDNQKPYRERKVRILNGAHTSSVLGAYLAGEDIVRNMMANPLTRAYVERAVYDELLPTVPLPKDEVRVFAEAVMERFENPFIDHALLSISLNPIKALNIEPNSNTGSPTASVSISISSTSSPVSSTLPV
jgi:hypothetical protein